MILLHLLLAAALAGDPQSADPDAQPPWRLDCDSHGCVLWSFGAGRNRAWAVPREAFDAAAAADAADGKVLLSITPCEAGEGGIEIVFDPEKETFSRAVAGRGTPAARVEPEGCFEGLAEPVVETLQGGFEIGHVYDLETPISPDHYPMHHAGRVELVNEKEFPALAKSETGRFRLRVEVIGEEIIARGQRLWTSEYFLRILDCEPVAGDPPP